MQIKVVFANVFGNTEHTRIFKGATRPTRCKIFLPYPNPKISPSCVRCGRSEMAHG